MKWFCMGLSLHRTSIYTIQEAIFFYFVGIDNYILYNTTLTSSLFIGHINVMTNSPILNF
jgi:hypothetical protein